MSLNLKTADMKYHATVAKNEVVPLTQSKKKER